MTYFSVIIPTYNQGGLIRRCIDSILAQTYPNFEIIIVNNYSEDDTLEVLSSFNDNRIRILNFHNNGVIAAARNRGIKEANGDWICFCDSDDWWKSNKLFECCKLVDSYDFLYHRMNKVSKNGTGMMRLGRKSHSKIFTEILTTGNLICNSSVSVKRNVLLSVGLMSEDQALIGVEDCDCWLRIAKMGYRFGFISKSLGYYWLGDNFSVSYKQLIKEELLFEKHASDLSIREKNIAFKNLFFRKARILHKLGDYTQCKYYYRKSICTKYWLRILKICILYSVAVLNRKM